MDSAKSPIFTEILEASKAVIISYTGKYPITHYNPPEKINVSNLDVLLKHIILAMKIEKRVDSSQKKIDKAKKSLKTYSNFWHKMFLPRFMVIHESDFQ